MVYRKGSTDGIEDSRKQTWLTKTRKNTNICNQKGQLDGKEGDYRGYQGHDTQQGDSHQISKGPVKGSF